MRGGALISTSLCHGEATPCPKPLRKFVLAVAVLGSSLGFIDGTIINVAIAPMREALGTSFAAMQWVVNAYTLALSAFLLVGGAAGDRYGKRAIFGLGIVIFAAASVVCGLAPNVEILIAARVVQGLGAALMVPGSLALIAVNFPQSERGRAVGIWAAASGVTSALGPILGGLLIDLGSWRAIFIINVPLAALTLALLWLRVPADHPKGGGRFDLPGSFLAFVAIGGLALGFTVMEQSGPGAVPFGLILAGALLCAAFVVWEGRTATPMLPLSLFQSRTFSVANAQTLLIYFALGGILFFVPITMMEAHGWSAMLAGSVFLPFTAAMALVSPAAGRLADRIGARVLLLTGPLIVAAAFVALAFAAANSSFWLGVAPTMALFGIGMGLAIPPLSAAILKDVDTDRSGIASAANNAVARVAGLLAVAMLGLMASLAYRAASGVGDVGFAAPLDPALVSGAVEQVRTEAILATFRLLALVCGALCLVAAALALSLPRLSQPDAAPSAAT